MKRIFFIAALTAITINGMDIRTDSDSDCLETPLIFNHAQELRQKITQYYTQILTWQTHINALSGKKELLQLIGTVTADNEAIQETLSKLKAPSKKDLVPLEDAQEICDTLYWTMQCIKQNIAPNTTFDVNP